MFQFDILAVDETGFLQPRQQTRFAVLQHGDGNVIHHRDLLGRFIPENRDHHQEGGEHDPTR